MADVKVDCWLSIEVLAKTIFILTFGDYGIKHNEILKIKQKKKEMK